MSDEVLIDLCDKIYENFGSTAVIDFISYCQDNNQLQQVMWRDCNGCDSRTPFIKDTCLVCGGY